VHIKIEKKKGGKGRGAEKKKKSGHACSNAQCNTPFIIVDVVSEHKKAIKK
jgi:hypothetical protein